MELSAGCLVFLFSKIKEGFLLFLLPIQVVDGAGVRGGAAFLHLGQLGAVVACDPQGGPEGGAEH